MVFILAIIASDTKQNRIKLLRGSIIQDEIEIGSSTTARGESESIAEPKIDMITQRMELLRLKTKNIGL